KDRDFGGDKVGGGYALGVGPHAPEHFDEFVAVSLHLDHQADVVDQAGQEGLVCQAQTERVGDHLGGGGRDVAVRPQLAGREVGSQVPAPEELGEAGGNGDVLDGVEAEHDDGPVDRADLPGQPVEGRVDDLQDAAAQRGVAGDDLVKVLGRGLGVLDQFDHLNGDLRERRDVADLAD